NFVASLDGLSALKTDAVRIVQEMKGISSAIKVNRNFYNSLHSLLPAEGLVTSVFGMRLSPFDGRRLMHTGIDIRASVGTTVVALGDGVVTFAGNFVDLGQAVVISHGFEMLTCFGQNEKLLVRTGQKVKRGQPIAASGNTGNTTGPHVHYEIWVNGVAVDPM